MLATKLNKLNWIPWVYMLEGNDSHGLSSDCPCALRHMLARVLELFWETASWFLTIKPTHSAVFLEELEPAGKEPLESQVSCLTLQTTGAAEKHFWAQNAERQNPNCSELQAKGKDCARSHTVSAWNCVCIGSYPFRHQKGGMARQAYQRSKRGQLSRKQSKTKQPQIRNGAWTCNSHVLRTLRQEDH